MTRVFANKPFDRWARRQRVSDDRLCAAVAEMEKGLWDANLGGSIYKKRVAQTGGGKRGGFRTLLAFKAGDKAFFVYGFSKSERNNITNKEELALKALGKLYLGFEASELQEAADQGMLRELECDDDDEAEE